MSADGGHSACTYGTIMCLTWIAHAQIHRGSLGETAANESCANHTHSLSVSPYTHTGSLRGTAANESCANHTYTHTSLSLSHTHTYTRARIGSMGGAAADESCANRAGSQLLTGI